MNHEKLAKAIKVRKSKISRLVDELEAANLIYVQFGFNGRRSNPKHVLTKVSSKKGRTSKAASALIHALHIGFPFSNLDRNSQIEIYLKCKVPILPFQELGKKPVINYKEWKRRPFDKQIDYFFNNPSLNVGFRIPRNILVIDLDTKYQKWSNLPEFNKTLTVSTAKGAHHYFTSDPVVNISTGSLLPNIDTRSNGCYVVIPPSRHESGVLYEWQNIVKLKSLPIEFRREWRTAYFQSSVRKFKFTLPRNIPAGTRNDTLWRFGRSMRAHGAEFDEIKAAIEKANIEACDPSLSQGELHELINHIWDHPNRASWLST